MCYQSVIIQMLMDALLGQPPETGAHSLLEHVFELSSLCWSQHWEGKLTCNLETKADQGSGGAVSKKAVIPTM